MRGAQGELKDSKSRTLKINYIEFIRHYDQSRAKSLIKQSVIKKIIDQKGST